MSIFFDFDVGDSGRRFRRAVDADRHEIDLFWDPNSTHGLFGEVNIGSLIELSSLAICMINERKKVVGFMALHDSPNVPAVIPADWEHWIRNMYQRFYLSRNTLFIHFICCIDSVADSFVEEALVSIFNNDDYLLQIVLVVPPSSTPDLLMYQTFRKRNILKIAPKRSDTGDNVHYIYVAQRKDFCLKLTIRRAVEEDNDDIVEIMDKLCPRLKQLYGEYYISELIGRHPESQRKIIVAQLNDRAVGVMCLNSAINYHYLWKMYELHPYFGLKKATSLEKEQCKRENTLRDIFADPILLGQRGPFDDVANTKSSIQNEVKSKPKRRKNKPSSRVNFKQREIMRRSLDHLYFNLHSDDFSDQVFLNSPTTSLAACTSAAVLCLEEDPFDYDIVNIDSNLLTVPEVLSYETNVQANERKNVESNHSLYMSRKKRKRQQSILHASNINEKDPVYQGGPNAFIIELFALRDDIDERRGFDLLEAAFEVMPDYDYCLIRVPCDTKAMYLLQHFTYVPNKSGTCCEYALYVTHRNAILGKFRVRKAEIIDVPQIVTLMQNLDGTETMFIVENSIKEMKQHEAYVLQCGATVVGFGVLEPPEQIKFIQAKFNMDSFHLNKYHYQNASSGFSTVKTIIVYPVFEAHFRFFAREMLRLSGCESLIWLTGYRNKWEAAGHRAVHLFKEAEIIILMRPNHAPGLEMRRISMYMNGKNYSVIHKSNCMVAAMIPLLPRQSDSICGLIPELKKFGALSKNLIPFSTWFINKKITTIQKINIDTRIVVVGASRTAMAFLNALLFSDASSYLTFTNVTLVSPAGLPYVRHCKAAAESMFIRHRTNTDHFLKSTPYTYYVNVVHGTVADINKHDKYVVLTSDHRVCYDKLFLLFGKQYQSPGYLQSILEKEKSFQDGQTPTYARLDDPSYKEPQINTHNPVPDNVFVINCMADANRALRYVKAYNWNADYRIIVYGATLHAYCCISALLDVKIPAANIAFVEPFPPENPAETRVPVFCNVYVDETIREVLNELGVSIYESYYFQSWSVDMCNLVNHVNFLSHYQMVELPCSALFYYGEEGINADAFLAIQKSGIAYNAGILIDHQFRTKDPSIFAAGPVSRYRSRYLASFKQHKYFESSEVGARLGAQIRNQLDPLFSEQVAGSKTRARSSVKSVSFDSTIDHSEDLAKDAEAEGSYCSNKSRDFGEKTKLEKVPEFVQPVVVHCRMPGGLQYLDVRSPGMKVPHQYIQSMNFNGYVMETFKDGYFKLHFTPSFIVDGVTCLSPEKYSLGHFRNLYGKSAVVLNNVHLKYTAKKVDNFYEFFNSPSIMFLYHEHVDELLSMAKELLPVGQPDGDTLKEALTAVSESLKDLSSKTDLKQLIHSKFEKSPHVEAITAYVLEWLSENDALLPMYLQPQMNAEFTHDLGRHPAFQRKKKKETS